MTEVAVKKISNKKYTPEFKNKIAKLAIEKGPRQISREYNIPRSTVGKWKIILQDHLSKNKEKDFSVNFKEINFSDIKTKDMKINQELLIEIINSKGSILKIYNTSIKHIFIPGLIQNFIGL